MAKHYIYSDNEVTPLLTIDTFDKDKLKEAILERLKTHPYDTLTHEKESFDKKHIGNDILGFYQNDDKQRPCRLIIKGHREYLKPFDITKPI